MFGGVAAKVNGNIFAGLFGLSTMVLLSPADRTRALAEPGAAPFDPMGTRRVASDKVMLPEAVMKDAAKLRDWLRKAFDYVSTLPAKAKTKPNPAPKAKPRTPPAKAKPAPARKR